MKMLKIVKLKDYFTLMNLASGFISILFAIDKKFMFASLFLLLAAFFDFSDGLVATLTKQGNKFGKELDSLADIVSFGIAPALFGYLYFSFDVLWMQIVYITALVFFASCGALRLARFNVTEIKHFEGIPITHSGYIIPLLYFVGIPGSLFVFYYIFAGLFMISSIRIGKVHKAFIKKRK